MYNSEAILKFKKKVLPLVKKGISILPDMKFGWKPIIPMTSVPVWFDFDYSERIEDDRKGVYQLVFKSHTYEKSDFIHNYINHIPSKYDGMVPEFTNIVEF